MLKPSFLAGSVLAVTAALTVFTPEARAADPQPLGAKFRPSNCTNCLQREPMAAGAASGAFFTVWDGASSTDPHAILGRRYNPAGAPQGGDVQINTDPQLEQAGAAVAVTAPGQYVMAWASRVGGANWEIFARRYRPNGSALGNVIKISADEPGTPTVPQDVSPAVAATLDGGFVVVWVRTLPASATFPGTTPEIWIRRYNSAGAAVKPPLKLSTTLATGERPDVCVDTLNRAVAVWTTVDEFRPFEPSLEGVVARRLAPTGVAVGGEITVAPPTARSTDASVSCGKTGTFAVAWHTDKAPATDRLDIVVRRFTQAGRPQAAAVRVNTVTDGDQRSPAISHDAAGNFVVVWESDVSNGARIAARRFTQTGAPASIELIVESVADGAPKPSQPEIAHLGTAGNFLVVWRDGTLKLSGQRYKP
jgi:hypothetical protein